MVGFLAPPGVLRTPLLARATAAQAAEIKRKSIGIVHV
jgi:hypothetical protein